MNIYGIGRNYDKHIQELGNQPAEEPVVFLKPDSALLRDNAPFYYPDYSKDIHHEVEIVLKINREGKYIDPTYAHKYFDEIGIGIDFTARDLQAKAKEKGLPWTIAKGFHGSAPVSTFLPKKEFKLDNLSFGLNVNDQRKQQGNTQHMIFNFDYIIAYLSRFFTLKKGDLIFTGTPEGVGPVQIGDTLSAYIEDKTLLEFEVK